MIKNYHTYGALDAKARALYGKRLRAHELCAVARMGSPAEIAGALHAAPGWQAAAAALPPDAGFAALECALPVQLQADYAGLRHYIPRRDVPLAAFPVMLAEADCILAVLRRLRAGRAADEVALPALPSGSRLNDSALQNCTGASALAAAATRTIYHKALLQLAGADALPDQPAAEAMLSAAYFSALFRLIAKRYSGAERTCLRRIFGQQADLQNIIILLRLKQFQPSHPRLLNSLIPFYDQLRPDTIRALAAASDPADCFSILRDTPFSACFQGNTVAEAEQACHRALCALYRSCLLTGPPTLCSLVAYYHLKEYERKALSAAIETARCGTVYDDSFAQLIGQ